MRTDGALEVLFPWLTRNGMGVRFGSRPVGWYQAHQCAALDYIRECVGMHAPIRLHSGIVQARVGGVWRSVHDTREASPRVLDTRTVFAEADRRARGIKR